MDIGNNCNNSNSNNDDNNDVNDNNGNAIVMMGIFLGWTVMLLIEILLLVIIETKYYWSE